MAACALGLTTTMLVSVPSTAAAPDDATSRASDRQVAFTRLPLATGTRKGLRLKQGALVLSKKPAGKQRTYRGTRYDVGTWTSAAVSPGFAATRLVASWAARTPRNSWVEVRVKAAGGRWLVLGRWAETDKHVQRTSVQGQTDAVGRVDIDTWASETGASSYQLQVRLMRRAGARSASPTLTSLGAVASRLPTTSTTSAPAAAQGTVLDVPRYSQMVHSGDFPQYGGGGEAWCSPTSLAMVLGYYGRLPAPSSYAWAGATTDPWVDDTARRTYDAAYGGTGNWPFNTAYAATRGLDAFVTRLRSLNDAEALVAAGIPVIASVSFPSGGLANAPISSTAGHLLVIVGFEADGDVVVNDPAASSSAGVRRTYDRAQLEKAWLGGSGGTVYVLHDAAHPLPPSSGLW